jgi:hypothetical protein
VPRVNSHHPEPLARSRKLRPYQLGLLVALIFSCEAKPPVQGQISSAETPTTQPGAQTAITPRATIEANARQSGALPGLILSPSDYASPAESLPGSNYRYPAEEIVPQPLDQSAWVSTDDQHIKLLEPEDLQPKALDLYDLSITRYQSYRSEEDALSFMPGDGDQFGWLSFESPNYLERTRHAGVTANMNMHLLSGPQTVHLPPRLYDFELGYQARNSLSDLFSYEWSAMVGIYSDFEDSARDGVRFPAHAVGMFHPGPRADWVFGVDYLDRGDIKVLPVFGACWHDPQRPELRYEMVFPRPRIDLTLSPETRLYSAGRLGGGTWDIEFPDDSNDVMTYRDYRMLFGIEHANEDGGLTSWELGWVFSRKLEFRDRSDEFGFGDAFVIRYVARN